MFFILSQVDKKEKRGQQRAQAVAHATGAAERVSGLVQDKMGSSQADSVLQMCRLAESEHVSETLSISDPQLWEDFRMTVLTGHVNLSLWHAQTGRTMSVPRG